MVTQSLERASGWGVLAALLVFPLAAIPRREELPWMAQFVAFYGAFGLATVSLMIGVIKGLPVWSLPSAGMFLAGFIYVTAFLDLNRFFMSLFPPYLPDPLYSILNSGSLWLGLLAVLITLAAVTPILPPLRPFYQRFRRDWTLLSFIVYGASPIGVYQAFDEYQHEGLYAVISILFLAAGAWLYLRSAIRRQRWLALFAALMLAIAVIVIGKWLILPVQDWPGLQGRPISAFRYWSEVMPTMVEWGWITMAMTVPALLALLPRPKQAPESL